MSNSATSAMDNPAGNPVAAGRTRRRNVLPGFGLSLGYTLLYLGLIVLIPLSAAFIKTSALTWEQFWTVVTAPRVMASYQLTFGASLFGAVVNAVFGLMVAWVLVRYTFPGKRILDALVDLPFALPTAVAGITLTALYAPNGWIGSMFAPGGWIAKLIAPEGIKIAFSQIGIVIALTFIGLPFVVRTLEPVMHDLAEDVEEAAASLGAKRLTIIRKVFLPSLAPVWLTGFAMAFARGLGEYGSVIFIAGNMPYKSEIAPLLIIIQLEQYDYHAAAGIALVLLVFAFLMLFVINAIQAWSRRFA